MAFVTGPPTRPAAGICGAEENPARTRHSSNRFMARICLRGVPMPFPISACPLVGGFRWRLGTRTSGKTLLYLGKVDVDARREEPALPTSRDLEYLSAPPPPASQSPFHAATI